jgi:hypothetical protein
MSLTFCPWVELGLRSEACLEKNLRNIWRLPFIGNNWKQQNGNNKNMKNYYIFSERAIKI